MRVGVHLFAADAGTVAACRREGDTLMVDTTNFTDKTRFRSALENLPVVERFTRAGAETFLYKVRLDDPATFSKQWTTEYPILATTGRFTTTPVMRQTTPWPISWLAPAGKTGRVVESK
jgi:hypothetical protein